MESKEQRKITEQFQRQKALEAWLQADCGLTSVTLQPMLGDASFRRYFRVSTQAGSLVAMDAPPPHENCRPYVAIANALRGMGLQTPEIMAADIEHGYLLITDLGDLTYLKALHSENANQLYQRALDALAILQSGRQIAGHTLPPFTRNFMWQEWVWHKEWFLGKLLCLPLENVEKELDSCYERIVESALHQPQVFMHRDYHSANLMVLPNNDMGILDFQDAFIGPVTYDLVSLLRDCYIDWPEKDVRIWVQIYWQKLAAQGVLRDVDEQQFLRWFDWMGMQRHLKALLTFARKHVRDQQTHYLQHVPRTLAYLLNTTQRYPECAALHDYLHATVQPAFERVMSTLCVA